MTKAESLGNLILAAGLEAGTFWLVVNEDSATITFHESVSMQLRTAAQVVIDEFDFSDAAQVARDNISLRDLAKNAIANDPIFSTRLAVAIALTARVEINILRQWITTFKAQTALATSLANLQTRVASNTPNLPDRTMAQLIQAIKDVLDSGDADYTPPS